MTGVFPVCPTCCPSCLLSWGACWCSGRPTSCSWPLGFLLLSAVHGRRPWRAERKGQRLELQWNSALFYYNLFFRVLNSPHSDFKFLFSMLQFIPSLTWSIKCFWLLLWMRSKSYSPVVVLRGTTEVYGFESGSYVLLLCVEIQGITMLPQWFI